MPRDIVDRYDELGRSVYEDEELQNEFCNHCIGMIQEYDTGAWVCRYNTDIWQNDCLRSTDWRAIVAEIEKVMEVTRRICRAGL